MITKSRVCNFTLAALVHAYLIVLLSIAVVAVAYVPDPVPEPMRITIGEQIVLPPATVPDPSEEPMPLPEGAEVPEPDDSVSPVAPNPEAMLIDPNEDLPNKRELAPEGALGEPRKDPTPLDKIQGNPDPDRMGDPKLFGEPISGNTLFLLDLSGSMDESYMGSTRLQVVIQELVRAIGLLTDTDRFDIVVYNGKMLSTTKALWDELMKATDDQRDAAIEWLKRLSPDGGTPTALALAQVCNRYREVDNLVLITDGIPDQGSEPIILDSIQKWVHTMGDAQLICISVGNGGLDFVKRLVDKVDGAYVLVE